MLIQRLREYAERHLADELTDPAFEPQPVPWLIMISRDGIFHGLQRTQGGVFRRGKKEYPFPKSFNVPKPDGPRAAMNASHPLLAVDAVAYVFGPGPWTKAGEHPKAQRHHDAFKRLVEEAAVQTSDDGLKAVAAFYANAEGYIKGRKRLEGTKVRPGDRYAFQLVEDAQPVFTRPPVRAFWRARFAVPSGAFSEPPDSTRCLSCSKLARPLSTHEKIKGLGGLGGQPSGTALISFDKEAFRSHGWEQGENSAICERCGQAYVRALNQLLDQKRMAVGGNGAPTGGGSLVQGGTAFVFWPREPDPFRALSLLEEPTSELIRQLLTRAENVSHPDPHALY